MSRDDDLSRVDVVLFTPTWFVSHSLGLGRSICCSLSGCSCRFHTCPRSRASSTRATSHTMTMSLMNTTRTTALAGTTHSERRGEHMHACSGKTALAGTTHSEPAPHGRPPRGAAIESGPGGNTQEGMPVCLSASRGFKTRRGECPQMLRWLFREVHQQRHKTSTGSLGETKLNYG